MLRSCCLSIVFQIVILQLVHAGKIEGTITTQDNDTLPYCNVYIKNSNYACASNEDGFYSLTVPPGNYVVTFQFIGFRKKEIEVNATKDIKLNVVLEEEAEELMEIVVHSGQEDPAYGIMRQAIELREGHLKETGSYSCEVYIKGLQKLTQAPEKIFGIELKTVLDLDSNNTGVIYLSESSSTFYYQYPDNTKEIMKASIVSGNDNSFSWNDAASMQMNFYENLQKLQGFSQRGFVSPVADNAMFYYKYQLISSEFENSHQVFKISVQPKRKTDPVFSGIIYITDDDYRLTGIQLQLLKENGMDFIDTFRVEQEYFYAEESRLMLLSNKFNFDYSIFGIKGGGYFHAFYKNYELNKIFGKHFFNGEVTKIEDGSNKKDSLYWSNIRPIKLTGEEEKDYHQKDSLQIIKESPAYKDSMDRIFNKFNFGDLLRGYSYRNTEKNIFINSNPIYDLVQYNTVEGYVINPRVRISKRWENKDEFSIIPAIRFGLGAKTTYPNLNIRYLYDQKSASSVYLHGGARVNQFNENGILPLANTVTTLFLESNYLKLYESQYIELGYSHEIINGLYGTIETQYAKRNQLFNLPDASAWFDIEDKTFTSNNYPFYFDNEVFIMPSKFTLTLNLKYKIGQQYIMEPRSKYVFESKYPVIQLYFENALHGIFNTGVQYEKIILEVSDNIALGLAGNLPFLLGAGIMTHPNELNVADQFNFSANETFIEKVQPDGYFLLPYYAAVSDHYYCSAHIQWHTEGFFFRKLPLFKQLKLEPVFSFNYLTANGSNFHQPNIIKNYMEFGAGVEHIFKVARIDFVYTPYRFGSEYPSNNFGVLVGIGF
ncbi:MAG: DUF5686 and carboxypeptidase regulatory-like domain-containing protein [Chitinophagales bacterium]